MTVRATTRVAGVVGRPITHSLSPLLHNAWLEASGVDGVYIALSPGSGGLKALVEGLRGGVMSGINVTVPFKEEALALADRADEAAGRAGAANLLLFHPSGEIEARNTDGVGLMAAFAEQAPGFAPGGGPAVILGAGGGARGAAAALRTAGCPQVRIVNRTASKAEALADAFGGQAYPLDRAGEAFEGAAAIINATSAGLTGSEPDWPLGSAPDGAVAMDMLYRPLRTPFLSAAQARGLRTVDGLAMLINQAVPSFQALFGQAPPASLDARALLLAALDGNA